MSDSLSLLGATKRPASRVLDAIHSTLWAIRPEMLETIIAIASRAHETPEAVLTKIAQRVDGGERVRVVDGVAVIPVIGPIMRYADFFTAISGATTIDALGRDLGVALRSQSVRGIVLEIDSPGGMISGVSEFADLVRGAAAQKPVTAYVSNLGASAAYWIASAAQEIVVRDTAQVGSIGVVIRTYRSIEDGTIKFVSRQSPAKQAAPESEDGRARYQAEADRLADVFVETVARNRGVTTEHVLDQFGQGGVLVGSDAVAAGMADRLGSLEDVIAGMVGESTSNRRKTTMLITRETIARDHPDIADAFRAEGREQAAAEQATALEAARSAAAAEGRESGAAAERARIQAVRATLLPGHEALVEQMMFDGTTSGPEAAVAILAAEKQTRSVAHRDRLADGAVVARVPAAAPGSDAAAGADDVRPIEQRCQDTWDRDPTVRAEFGEFARYLAFEKASAAGQVRIKRG